MIEHGESAYLERFGETLGHAQMRQHWRGRVEYYENALVVAKARDYLRTRIPHLETLLQAAKQNVGRFPKPQGV